VRRLPDAYVPGKTITVSLNFPYPYIADWTSFYGFVQETIPPGWSLVWSNIPPTGFSEQSGTIYWSFEFWCTFGISIRYYVTPPPAGMGEVSFDGFCFSSRTGPNQAPFFHAPTAGDATLTGRVGVARLVPKQYPTIQAAIDASSFGDRVVVSNQGFPYTEEIHMKQEVDLLGSGLPPVVQKGGAICAAANTRIEGIHITSGGTGIWIGDHDVEVSNCLITGMQGAAVDYYSISMLRGRITNCTIVGNGIGVDGSSSAAADILVTNCIFRDNGCDVTDAHVSFSCLQDEIADGSGENNIYADPMFYRAEDGVYTLMPGSPCIDAGDNSAVSPAQKDLAGNRRIMFGGKGLRVDMGAYERRAQPPRFQPLSGNFQLTWSSIKEKTYSVFFSEDLTTWHLADDNVPGVSGINAWLDPIGWPPRVPVRFYRVMENE